MLTTKVMATQFVVLKINMNHMLNIKLFTIFYLLFFNVCIAQLKDINVQANQIVVLGKQTWMAENLNVDKFKNGDLIPEAKTPEDWKRAGEKNQPAWCYYNNDPINGQKYGKLYNWYAANDPRGLAPEGWHIPSREEFDTLVQFSGDSLYSYNLKANNGWDSIYYEGVLLTCLKCQDWDIKKRNKKICDNCYNNKTIIGPLISSNGNGNDLFHFGILPSGARLFNGQFGGIGKSGTLISTSETTCESCGSDSPKNQFLSLPFTRDKVDMFYWEKYNTACEKAGGYSIRCIKNHM